MLFYFRPKGSGLCHKCFHSKYNLFENSTLKYNILISQIWVFFSQWIQSDLLQFSTCNIHSWSIDCYSSGNYLKRESSCAFLMDCACLPLLYMDRELVWRSVILFSQSLPSTLLFGGRISTVFTPYFSSASRMTRLNDLESSWRWISLSLPFLLFSGISVTKKDDDLLPSGFHWKYPLSPAPNLFMSLICYVFFHYIRVEVHHLQHTSIFTLHLIYSSFVFPLNHIHNLIC